MKSKKPVTKRTGDSYYLLKLKDLVNDYAQYFLCEIDTAEFDEIEKTISVSGWALCKINKKAPKVNVLVPRGFKIKSYEQIVRQDVEKAHGLDKDEKTGFKIVLQASEDIDMPETAHLVLAEEETGIHLPVDVNLKNANSHFFDSRSFHKYYMDLYREKGFKEALKQYKIQGKQQWDPYNFWLEKHKIKDIEAVRREINRLEKKPKISIVVPVYNLEEKYLRRAVDSVRNQIYENWELVLVDDKSPSKHVREVLSDYAAKDSRIKLVFRKENGNISKATNSGLNAATGEYIAFMDHDDELTPEALYEYVKLINNEERVDLVYSDQDFIAPDGYRHNPFFKSNWNPRLLLGHNYISHFLMVSRDLLEKTGPLRSRYNGSQDYDFLLRALPQAERIFHIPKILYHWRMVEGSVAEDPEAKNYAYETGKEALESYLKAFNMPGEISINNMFGTYKLKRTDSPSVTVIILAEDEEKSRETLQLVLEDTDYPDYNVIAVNYEREINTTAPEKVSYVWNNKHMTQNELLNYAAQRADGEYLVFIRPGAYPQGKDWLKKLVDETVDAQTGIVGVMLLDEERKVLNAGAAYDAPSQKIIYPGEGRDMSVNDVGYFYRLSLPQNVMAVSSFCFLISKELFEELGGFSVYTHPLKEIDLSLKALKKGKRTVFNPGVKVIWKGEKADIEHEKPKKKRYFYKNPHSVNLYRFLKEYSEEELKDIYTNDVIQRFRRAQDPEYEGLMEDAYV